MLNKIILSIKNAIINWRTEWGNLLIVLIPLTLAFPVVNKAVAAKWYLMLLVVVLFLSSWIQTNLTRDSIVKLKQDISNRDNEISSLQNTVESLNNTIEATPEMIIKYIAVHLGLNYQDRISIYRYDIDAELFIPVGRYSQNPEYTKRGRTEYPKNKGYIAKAWMNGTYYKTHIPDFDVDSKKYIEYVSNESGIDKGVVKKMTMKSRCYFCKNLRNNTQAIAVIVIESMTPVLSQSQKELEELLDGPFGKLLVESIENNLPIGKGE